MTATLTDPTAQPSGVPTSRSAPTAPGDGPPTLPADPRWTRPALAGLLGLTAVLYLWGLSANGWANSFYSAAVQAGTKSWSAFFFGSSDAAGSITVDKPPASLWVMELSARIFGVNSWSILVPEALMGVAAVYLLYLTIRRWAGGGAGLLAGLALAVTPVATLMFRFNNPDAMLVLVMVAAVYTTTRAIDAAARRAGTRWLMLTGALVGLAFLTKSLQALLVVPGLALVYLIVAPTPLRRRLLQLVAAGVAMLVSGLWWVVVVTLIPASSRPYIGGSQHNSVWELIWGYNGLGRLTGNETGSVGGGGGGTGTGMWGSTGLTRLFSSDIGGQIAWLLPAALLLLGAGLWFTRRAPRTDRSRALLIVWGGWLLTTGLTFSEMKGIFHQYYTVALAPAVAALVGVGAASLWRGRRHVPAALALATTVAVTAIWSFVLLDRSASWHPWLRYAVLLGGLVAAAGIAASRLLTPRVAAGVAGLAVVASLAGPAAYSIQTASVGHSGSIVTAGPTVAGSTGGPGGMGGARPGGGGGTGGGFGGPPGQTTGGTTGGTATGGTATQGGRGGQTGVGSLLNGSTSSAAMTALLKADASSYRWAAAAIGSQNASGYQLASGESVMPIGGFNGSDPSPTLAEFKALVAKHEIHYFIASGGVGAGPGGQGGSSNTASQISSWVESTFTAKTVGGVTVYDLTTG
jgi:4-amino-4-deoxy-L-arabinose transferase-like glycosyltransferase